MNRIAKGAMFAAGLAAGCATAPPSETLPAPVRATPPASPGAPAVAQRPAAARILPILFSKSPSLEDATAGWHPFRLLRFKPHTTYRLVEDEGVPVVHAFAKHSVSGLHQTVSFDLRDYPVATWRWRVPKLIAEANNESPVSADSPARLVFTFEGGRERLPPHEQLTYDIARAMTGNEMPYATLMYIWEPDRPEGEVITHYNTSRVKMIVAANGKRDLSRWQTERVNLMEDFRRAFGEDPPRVRSVGIMTDSDNTSSVIEAWYGDIRLLPE